MQLYMLGNPRDGWHLVTKDNPYSPACGFQFDMSVEVVTMRYSFSKCKCEACFEAYVGYLRESVEQMSEDDWKASILAVAEYIAKDER